MTSGSDPSSTRESSRDDELELGMTRHVAYSDRRVFDLQHALTVRGVGFHVDAGALRAVVRESFGALGGTLRVFGAVGTVSGTNTYQWARLWFAHREPVQPDQRAQALATAFWPLWTVCLR